mmetsp:Transcript_44028/g.95759  ORF Transcript_44028/g.95759 Transcript_44028/m.95759 type:complete len:94 (+) Transcript_44028:663-944(+)
MAALVSMTRKWRMYKNLAMKQKRVASESKYLEENPWRLWPHAQRCSKGRISPSWQEWKCVPVGRIHHKSTLTFRQKTMKVPEQNMAHHGASQM